MLEDISTAYLGDVDGIDINLDHIKQAGRIDVWTGPDKEKTRLVQFIDIETASAVIKAIRMAGFFKQRKHVRRGKYMKTGEKTKDKDNAKIIEDLKDSFARASSTKDEREEYRNKKDYKKGQVFKAKSDYQEYRRKRVVHFSKLKLVRKTDGKVDVLYKNEDELAADKVIQGLLNRWTSQLDLDCTTGGLERVVSVHNST